MAVGLDRVIRGVEAKDVDDELSGNAGKTDEAPQPAVPTDTGSMWLPRPYLVLSPRLYLRASVMTGYQNPPFPTIAPQSIRERAARAVQSSL